MSHIIGVGVDLLHLPRFAALLNRKSPERLAKYILSSSEHQAFAATYQEETRTALLGVQFCDLQLIPPEQRSIFYFLATRWTAKEAAYKALSPRYRLAWHEVTIAKDGRRPCLLLDAQCKLAANVSAAHLSISHDGDYAVAVVTFEGQTKSNLT
ncbi:4'-phosphopantetheinyl transferase superfamily [Polychytrium aggregatum]|uniref:4'-phosphopantetheinyl transferase superfamily n=1 Tax=Polychytrium aggregatum TaxID=110093 RepID=UPI0022FE5FDE|nr:4'-phosphopantetheinyl transferase superfamily [Polychytrium aggregatum]KAI9209316.1 4'-phosphopantetheinyl transferase superfamily [Polychytrium aggregatum]